MNYNQQGWTPAQQPPERRTRTQRAQQEQPYQQAQQPQYERPAYNQQAQYTRPSYGQQPQYNCPPYKQQSQYARPPQEPQQIPYQPQAPVQTQVVNVNVNASALGGVAGTESYFDGALRQQIGYAILGALITMFTFGICYPWALCMQYSWEAKHTVINGKRLAFDGKASQLFGKWIVWSLLTIVTFGIYSFWLSIALKKWITKHTHFAS